MKRCYFTFLFILLFSCKPFCQNADTVINGKHYNTVICYQTFNYKETEKPVLVYAFGNTVKGVKQGLWIYALESGKVLGQGKFRNGFKKGTWYYLTPSYTYRTTEWKRSRKVQDVVRFANNRDPQIVDFDSRDCSVIEINSNVQQPHFRICWL